MSSCWEWRQIRKGIINPDTVWRIRSGHYPELPPLHTENKWMEQFTCSITHCYTIITSMCVCIPTMTWGSSSNKAYLKLWFCWLAEVHLNISQLSEMCILHLSSHFSGKRPHARQRSARWYWSSLSVSLSFSVFVFTPGSSSLCARWVGGRDV